MTHETRQEPSKCLQLGQVGGAAEHEVRGVATAQNNPPALFHGRGNTGRLLDEIGERIGSGRSHRDVAYQTFEELHNSTDRTGEAPEPVSLLPQPGPQPPPAANVPVGAPTRPAGGTEAERRGVGVALRRLGVGSDSVMQLCCYAVIMAERHDFVTVQGRGLIAIPAPIRRHLGLDEPGAQVEVIERDGEVVLRPHVAVPADQAWFWTERWQQMEREADEDFPAGRSKVFDNIEDLLADLES